MASRWARHLEWIQAFRSVGSFILDANGKHFVNEIGRRDSMMSERPTTNGEHCTGDGVTMGEAINAKPIDR